MLIGRLGWNNRPLVAVVSKPDGEDSIGQKNQPCTCKAGFTLVGARGFEPPASASRTLRSTRLSHAPIHQRMLASQHTLIAVVPKVGVEPTRACTQRFLRPPRLPFRHFGIDKILVGVPRFERGTS